MKTRNKQHPMNEYIVQVACKVIDQTTLPDLPRVAPKSALDDKSLKGIKDTLRDERYREIFD